jgi:hypothetical protein
MDFPATWVVLQLEQFDTALPDIEGDITVELLAHLRSSGRALDPPGEFYSVSFYSMLDKQESSRGKSQIF